MTRAYEFPSLSSFAWREPTTAESQFSPDGNTAHATRSTPKHDNEYDDDNDDGDDDDNNRHARGPSFPVAHDSPPPTTEREDDATFSWMSQAPSHGQSTNRRGRTSEND